MAHLKPARALWTSLGLPLSEAQTLKLLMNPELATNSSFKIGDAAQVGHYIFSSGSLTLRLIYQTSIGLSALSAAYFHKLRTGIEQDVCVDARHAAIEFRECACHHV